VRLLNSCLIVLACASPALADDKAKAKTLYQEGLNHYNLAEWQEAIKSWKESYILSKKPLLLFNIGQAYRLSGDCKQAMIFYDSYQREEPNPKNGAELEEALALCAKQPDKPVDKPVNKPLDKPVVTTPPVDKPVVVAQKPEPQQPVEPVDSGPTTSGGGLRKVGYIVGGAGVVMTGVGIYFALDASSTASDLDGYMGEWGQEQIDLEASGKNSATMGKVFTGLGVAAVVAGGVMYVVGGPKSVESSGVAIAPTRGGAAMSWSLRF
jgi:hypothetical protein